jgi:hypothetical protein
MTDDKEANVETAPHNVDDLYTQCRYAMSTVETSATQVRNILMNAFKVKFEKSTRAFVFPSEEKSSSPELKKDTITSMLNSLNKIIKQTQNTDDILASLNDVNKAACKQLASTIIEEVKKQQFQPKVKYAVTPTYAEAVTSPKNPETREQHTLVINAKDASVIYGEIKRKVRLKEKKIKLTKEPCFLPLRKAIIIPRMFTSISRLFISMKFVLPHP